MPTATATAVIIGARLFIFFTPSLLILVIYNLIFPASEVGALICITIISFACGVAIFILKAGIDNLDKFISEPNSAHFRNIKHTTKYDHRLRSRKHVWAKMFNQGANAEQTPPKYRRKYGGPRDGELRL